MMKEAYLAQELVVYQILHHGLPSYSHKVVSLPLVSKFQNIFFIYYLLILGKRAALGCGQLSPGHHGNFWPLEECTEDDSINAMLC